MLSAIIGAVCLVWCSAVVLVSSLGYVQILRHFSKKSRDLEGPTGTLADVPHVTVIRPVKGLEPDLYECLAATFRQTYRTERLTISFCISSRDDPALPTLEKLLVDFSKHDARIYVEEEDDALQFGELGDFGPNPKIRNMSRAYREAKGDIVWIIDCNVWVARGAANSLVKTLCGSGNRRPYKFVHQLPLVVDITNSHEPIVTQSMGSRKRHMANANHAISSSSSHYERISLQHRLYGTQRLFDSFGGRLDETFLSSAHAKFYTAINALALAPCIVGKSNMFRRSHLDALTEGRGIDFFSHNICEDHLIGDLLWKQHLPCELRTDEHYDPGIKYGKHAMVFGDIAIQPTAHMSLAEYISRRMRWLRVRKFTVTMATLVEPGTESFVCCAYAAWAITSPSAISEVFGAPQSWLGFWFIWGFGVIGWCVIDWTLYCTLLGMYSVEVDADNPAWAKGPRRRTFRSWLAAWISREMLALPIWIWAVWGGVSVVWRGRRFRVGMDMKVHALDESSRQSMPQRPLSGSSDSSRSATPKANGKARLE